MDLELLRKNKRMVTYTLTFLFQEDKVLLGLKKRGFAQGKWNGFGGKVNPGESIVASAAREIEEECGLKIKEEDLEVIGVNYYECDSAPGLVREVYMLRCLKFQGEVEESEEMEPKWYPNEGTPREDMWPDDVLWYTFLKQGHPFLGYYLYGEDDRVVQFIIVDSEDVSHVRNSYNFDNGFLVEM